MGLLCPWDFPSKNTEVGCHFLLGGSFLPRDGTRVSRIGRQILYHWTTREALLVISQYWVKLFISSASTEFDLMKPIRYHYYYRKKGGFPGGSDGKESAYNVGDLGSILGLARSPGGGHGNPFLYSSLKNPQGQRSLVGYSPWGHKELDTTEWLSTAWLKIQSLPCKKQTRNEGGKIFKICKLKSTWMIFTEELIDSRVETGGILVWIT